MNFKQFLVESAVLLEGGAALKASKITQSEAKKIIPEVIKQVATALSIPTSAIKLIGSAGKKPNEEDESGDIDLAVRAEASDVESALKELAFDKKSFKAMKGINVYSFAYDLGGKKVQVDLMPVSNPYYAEWASQANEEDLKDGLKGSHRNELFFAIAKFMEPKVLKTDTDGTPLVIERYFYDLQKGLMKGTQSRERTKKSSKSFKTVSKTVVTDDPVQVTKKMFGNSITPDQVSTFKGALAVINSQKFAHKEAKKDIIEMSKIGMKKKGLSVPSYL